MPSRWSYRLTGPNPSYPSRKDSPPEGSTLTKSIVIPAIYRHSCESRNPASVDAVTENITQESFEETIRELTQPINGQLPRPWMTQMTDPLQADVFIVGMHQAKKYPADRISHQRHMDALFNRNGESCRGLYDEATEGKPSPTRRNFDNVTDRLNRRNIHNILETDLVCYSTPKRSDLKSAAHAGGEQRGREIFRYLLTEIAPIVLVVHGVEVVKQFSRILKVDGLRVPRSPDEICDVQTDKHLVIPIPSLASRAFNMWRSWSDEYLDDVADRVREKLGA